MLLIVFLSCLVLQPGPVFASHPLWDGIKLIHAHDSALQKIQCSLPLSDSVPGQGIEVNPEVMEDCGNLEFGPSGTARPSGASGGRVAAYRKRSSSKRSGNSTSGDTARSTSRPVLHASPSGAYCAVHWPESMTYVVLCVNIAPPSPAKVARDPSAVGPVSGATIEVDRGHCLEFAWVGTEDSYLVSTRIVVTVILLSTCPSCLPIAFAPVPDSLSYDVHCRSKLHLKSHLWVSPPQR
jgi:hypothetical protein